MREAGGGSMLHSWRALFGAGPVGGLEDGSLLERFAHLQGDDAETAFAALVTRHGPMVRRVCQRVLDDPHDADDAFQATFLVLARKARGIQRPERLANWLYGTALRASRRLRADLARRKRHEAARQTPTSEADPDRSEEAEIVLEEVARLPQAYRVAVVLCDLEGLTQEEAARRLGCSDRTLRRRLTHAHDLLRGRLARRGLAPPLAVLAPQSGPVPQFLIDATARLAGPFASGPTAAGVVPAPALILAEGVIAAMTWTRWMGIAVVATTLLALGVGISAASGFRARSADEPAKSSPKPKPDAQAVAAKPSPAERYRALVKQYDDAVKVYQAVKTTNEAERTELYKSSPMARDYSPPFVALAEEFPSDPVAVDALLWVAEGGLSAVYSPDRPGCRAFARALEILARDHADEPRVGEYCPSLTRCPDALKSDFLRAVAGRSKNPVVKGRATLALAEYLRFEAGLAELFQHPDRPVNFDVLLPADTSEDERRRLRADPAAYRRQVEEFYARHLADYMKLLKRADITSLRRESEQAYARVLADFAAAPAVPPYGKPPGATLADVIRKRHEPRPPIPPASRVKPLAEAYKAAEATARAASQPAGPGVPGVKAYIAAAPKWADYGPKMWAIAQATPGSPEAFDALLWIIHHHMPFFDSAEEWSATIGRAVDALIRDHLDFIGDHLDTREVAEAFNHWQPVPAPHIDRIFRTLYERGRTRDIRGKMGFALARHRKTEADLTEGFELRGADPARHFEFAIFTPSYLESLRRSGHRRITAEAETLFEKVKADYGDVAAIGVTPTGEPIATAAAQELADIRTLTVGQAAPEIGGTDADGKPMTLSEFRGKVVVLDFGSHEHCGACRLVYPKLRELVEKYNTRPFAVLGINNYDRLEVLRDLAAKKAVTWRCWWDGDKLDRPGPITTRWNIRVASAFVVLDDQGVIRFKNLHPADPQFDQTIERLVKAAESARR
jgi:RNA polymerase sigma factor (sigma-70 family)